MRSERRWFVSVATVIAAASTPVLAQEAAERPQVLVLDLDHSGDIPQDVARTLTDLVTVETSKHELFRVLSGTDLRNLADLEGQKEAAGCDGDASCLAEIAGALGARFVVSGRVSSLGSLQVLQLSLFDASSAQAIARQAVQAEDLETFAKALGPVVDKLMAKAKTLLKAEAEAKGRARADAVRAAMGDQDNDASPAASADDDDAAPLSEKAAATEANDDGLNVLLWSGVGVLAAGAIGVLASALLASASGAVWSIEMPGAPNEIRIAAGVAAWVFGALVVVGALAAIGGGATAVVGAVVE